MAITRKHFSSYPASTHAPANDVAARRDLARTHYRNYVEGKLKEMVSAKSVNGPIAGKKAMFESSLDPQKCGLSSPTMSIDTRKPTTCFNSFLTR